MEHTPKPLKQFYVVLVLCGGASLIALVIILIQRSCIPKNVVEDDDDEKKSKDLASDLQIKVDDIEVELPQYDSQLVNKDSLNMTGQFGDRNSSVKRIDKALNGQGPSESPESKSNRHLLSIQNSLYETNQRGQPMSIQDIQPIAPFSSVLQSE